MEYTYPDPEEGMIPQVVPEYGTIPWVVSDDVPEDGENWGDDEPNHSSARFLDSGFQPMDIDDGSLDPEYDDAVSDVSDADSVYLGVQDQISRAQATRAADLAIFDELPEEPTPEPTRKFAKRAPDPARKIIKRGPRKPKELPTEIKVLVSAATNAFLESRYDEALQTAKETIRLNAEVPAAWGIMATIYEEEGDWRHALEAKRIQASLTRTDAQLWQATAELALRMADTGGGHGSEVNKNLKVAMECYQSLLLVDKTNMAARLGKADILAEMAHYTKAVTAYSDYLKVKPHHLRVVRSLAEHAYNARRPKEAIEGAVAAYKVCILHSQAGNMLEDEQTIEWVDVSIFLELLASLEKYEEAAKWLKSLVRWLLGRAEETFWEGCSDDREWDIDDERRRAFEGFRPGRFSPDKYGPGLPLELRGKLAIYRFRMDMDDEAMKHLTHLHHEDETVREDLKFTPNIAKELADQLCENDRPELGLKYYDIFRDLTEEPLDSEYYVSRGKCHLLLSDFLAAEDCYISALDVDGENIEARYELAKIYEEAQEREEAFRLVGEALSLEAGQTPHDRLTHRYIVDRGKIIQKPRKYRSGLARKPNSTRPKYRPRRLLGAGGGDSARKRFEEEVTARLRERYAVCQRLKAEMDAKAATNGGDYDMSDPVVTEWMSAAKELVDDFRSFREFYSWERYVSSLGYGNFFTAELRPKGNVDDEKSGAMAKMAKRLHSKLAPAEPEGDETAARQIERSDHRGIPFDDWLDLFLSYAVALSRRDQIGEAYAVCQSARDSIVYSKARDSMTLIHVAWASCAVRAGDEETCVAIARYFIVQNAFSTDAYMMFAALTRVCQTSSAWYQSGPSQKFMLRQIRQIDEILAARQGKEKEAGTIAAEPNPNPPAAPSGVDCCLLMVYGCILFSSTSYQYALAYFLRARSLDPANPAINLVIGLGYIHWALKRQSQNRQHAIMQGMSFLFRYYDDRMRGPGDGSRPAAPEERQEANYNVARTYHLLGLFDLAVEYYRRVLEEARVGAGEMEGKMVGRREDLVLEAALNMRTFCLTTGDLEGARAIVEEWLVL